MKGRMIGFKRFWPSGDGFKGPGNSIMKREETYIPYKERTPKELCRDIYLKAEKLFLKKDKFGLLIFAVFFLVLVALHFYYRTYVNLWLGAIVVGVILAVGFNVFKTYLPQYGKYRLLIWALAFAVCVAMEWRYMTYAYWGLGAIVVGAILAVGFNVFKTYLPRYGKYRLVIWVLAFAVCVAIEWRYMTNAYWGLGAIVVGAILVVNFVFFLINRRLVNDMNLAATPKQFLPMVKRLKKCFQFRNFLCLSLLFWLPFLTLDDFHDVWRIAELLILYILGALFSNRDFWIDPAFSDDVEELEYRLEEQA